MPASYREMPGFGVHTYTLINREGKVTYVKFHWLPKAGGHYIPPIFLFRTYLLFAFLAVTKVADYFIGTTTCEGRC